LQKTKSRTTVKIWLLAAAMFCCVCLLTAQTKRDSLTGGQNPGETEKWLVETINKYMKPDTIRHFTKTADGWVEGMMTEYIPESFAIKDDRFFITYRKTGKDPGPVKIQKTKLQAYYAFSRYTASAPIIFLDKLITRQKPADDDSNKYTGGSYLAIQFQEENVIAKASEYEMKITDFLPLFIDPEAEPGLVTHLQDALTRLKTLSMIIWD